MSPCVSTNKSKSQLSAITFFAKSHPGDVCGSNGLPLTPNSIAIFGKAQILKSIEHVNLCEYLDIIRDKHERIIVVSQYCGQALSSNLKLLNINEIFRIFYQIANGLAHLNSFGIVCQNLQPDNILFDNEEINCKLFNYGLFHMTNGGEYVTFPIGNVRYMSPERILGSKFNCKSDTWSLGIIIVELIFRCKLWASLNTSQTLRKIQSFIKTNIVLENIAKEHNNLDTYENLDDDLKELLKSCLSISIKNRPTPNEIINNKIFKNCLEKYTYNFVNNKTENVSLLLRCPLKQLYYWWQLAGGDVQTELKKEGLIRSEAPILLMPQLVLMDGTIIAPPRGQSYMLDNRIIMLNLTNLTERLSNIKPQAFFPLIHTKQFSINYGMDMEKLPLIIRERDTEYQFYRVILFTRLLQGYPYTYNEICNESQKDIPPLLRGQIWSCLLGVIENGSYNRIDKITPTQTDRQIDVDIPRCHQYDELLSSPEGHRKLKRLLKAWVTAHPQYVYWQGLDSLTAPFLYLNFNNEERAFLSLFKFIPKYLHWFFLRDNSAIIKEYLSKFSQLTTFHEPILAKHLSDINFIPELFAIPWFLTMFSHVFPLHKIIHLWDKLILGDNSYPFFIGISVLKQLKTTLLSSGFNECILLFSDLPDIVMETCVIESHKMYTTTPKSISYRKHVLRDAEPNDFDIDGIELKDLQNEMCPRISANDLLRLLNNKTVAIIDLRTVTEYKRAHIEQSINIPYTTTVALNINNNNNDGGGGGNSSGGNIDNNNSNVGDDDIVKRLDVLNIPDLEHILFKKTVVIVSIVHEQSISFSKYLIECGVQRVCTLHKGFNILHKIVPNILITSR